MAAKKKKKKSTPAKKPKPPPKMIIRRNAAPSRPTTTAPNDDEARAPLTQRIEQMDGSHVATGIGAGVIGSVAGVMVVGQGWVGPKATAGILMGTGSATAAAGWYWDADHLMSAGVGLAAAGAFSLTNQYAIDAYEAMEKRAQEKRAEKEKEQEENDRATRLAEARALLEQEAKGKRAQMRNGRRIVVVDADGEVIEHPAQATA